MSKKHRPVRNEKLYRAMVELRRSNAAGKHDPRPNRQRSRADAKRAAIRESMD